MKGEIPWTSEPFVKAIDKLDEWWGKGYFGPNYFSLNGEQQVAQLANGQAGMMPSGTPVHRFPLDEPAASGE